jgi:hypothetical protein
MRPPTLPVAPSNIAVYSTLGISIRSTVALGASGALLGRLSWTRVRQLSRSTWREVSTPGRATSLKALSERLLPTPEPNYNTDVSEYWEFSATGFGLVDESNEAYKLARSAPGIPSAPKVGW